MTVETHPLEPFLPEGGGILFLGSFPPPRARWSMEFFYPNFINDFWRIMGLLFYDDREHFVVAGAKRFDREAIVDFARREGLAFYDTAYQVRRLKDNANDNFLEIVEPTNVGALLAQMPQCHRLVSTGQKSGTELLVQINREREALGVPLWEELPTMGSCLRGEAFGREIEFWRMPSTSRAYPLALAKKAEFYGRLFREE